MLLSSINTTFIRRNRRIHILYSTMGNTLVSFCMLLILKTKRRIQGDFGHLKFVKKLANWQNINTISNAESITMRPSCHLPSLHGIRVNKRTSFARWLFDLGSSTKARLIQQQWLVTFEKLWKTIIYFLFI